MGILDEVDRMNMKFKCIFLLSGNPNASVGWRGEGEKSDR